MTVLALSSPRTGPTWPEEDALVKEKENTPDSGRSLTKTLLCMLILSCLAIVILAGGLVLALQSTASQKNQLDDLQRLTNEQQTQLDHLQQEIDRLQDARVH